MNLLSLEQFQDKVCDYWKNIIKNVRDDIVVLMNIRNKTRQGQRISSGYHAPQIDTSFSNHDQQKFLEMIQAYMAIK